MSKSDLIKKEYSTVKDPGISELVSELELKKRVEIISKCIDDPIYFIRNFYWIRSIDKGTILCPPYDAQCDLIRSIIKNRKIISLASRQSGKTTAYIGVCLWICFFMSGKEIIILANKEKTAIGILKRIKRAYEWIPKNQDWIKPGVTKWSEKQIEFENGCSITAMATSSDTARSNSAYLCIIDEASFVPIGVMEDLWASVYPLISRSSTSKFVMVSTPNGLGGKFCEIWQDATLGKNPEWTPVFIPWYVVPGRDEEWKRKEIAGLGPSGDIIFRAEYDCEFLGSSPTLLNPDIMKELIALNQAEENITKETLWKVGNEKAGFFDITIYKQPIAGHAYVLGGDVAEGVGLDASVSKIFDITDCFNIEEVASFESNKIPGVTFGYVMSKMALKYNNAYVACERNGVSATAIDALWRTFEYENIIDVGSNKFATGIFSNHATKLEACMHFRDLLKDPDFNLIIRDSTALLEFQRFEKVKAKAITRYEASTGHDDKVMAIIWAIYVTKPDLVERYYSVVATKRNSFNIEVPARLKGEDIVGDNYITNELELEMLKKKIDSVADEKLRILNSGTEQKMIESSSSKSENPNNDSGEALDFFFN